VVELGMGAVFALLHVVYQMVGQSSHVLFSVADFICAPTDPSENFHIKETEFVRLSFDGL
jgi:hypothetical protein